MDADDLQPLTRPRAATDTTRNVLVVGVGGQGVIMISRVLAKLCQQHGHTVKQSEVHGMAKRGGVVFSHIRFGEKVYSPTIPRGEADILVALEWAEALRWLPHLRPENGTLIADTRRIVPPFSCRNRKKGAGLRYVSEEIRDVIARVPSSYALDASAIASRHGNQRVANTVLLGALSTALDFPADEWRQVISEIVPAKTVESNLRAFDEGRDWVLESRGIDGSDAAATVEPAQVLSGVDHDVNLEITEAWCKGCDICVKLCPERCLRLNARQLVELADPGACTGCRLCEWLCPDFAIRVA
jgi:indolepyruvate ferredoxin oxidoreductase beta subunit